MDVFTKKKRSEVMSRIRGTDTKLEVEVRSRLFCNGFRFRKNDKRYPGKPDIVLPKHQAVIFINGCFWHYHKCSLFKMPSTRTTWWKNKLKGNKKREIKSIKDLKALNWRTLIIWECAIRGKGKKHDVEFEKIIKKTERWLLSKSKTREISS